jgi:hypothetical protein
MNDNINSATPNKIINYPWLRLWREMHTDPKWRVIAKESGQSIGNVIATYIFILQDASDSDVRGQTKYVDNCEEIAAGLDLDNIDVEKILTSMQHRVLDGAIVTGWVKRQPKREDDSSERVKAWREAKKDDVTQGNALKRTVTQDVTRGNAREDKRRVDKNINTEHQIAFDLLWESYPKKQGKKEAQKAFLKVIEKTPIDVIMAGLVQYVKDPTRNPAYTKNPATWLNGECWNDQPVTLKAVNPYNTNDVPTQVPPRFSAADRERQEYDDNGAIRKPMPANFKEKLNEAFRSVDSLDYVNDASA